MFIWHLFVQLSSCASYGWFVGVPSGNLKVPCLFLCRWHIYFFLNAVNALLCVNLGVSHSQAVSSDLDFHLLFFWFNLLNLFFFSLILQGTVTVTDYTLLMMSSLPAVWNEGVNHLILKMFVFLPQYGYGLEVSRYVRGNSKNRYGRGTWLVKRSKMKNGRASWLWWTGAANVGIVEVFGIIYCFMDPKLNDDRYIVKEPLILITYGHDTV